MQKCQCRNALCRQAGGETPMQAGWLRNAGRETPKQKRQCSNAPWNATAQKQCAAMGLVCPTLRKKSGKQASELASKQPSKRTSELVTEQATGKRTSEQVTEQASKASELAGEAWCLGEESEEDSGGYCAANYAGYVWSHCVH